jgi:ABC-type Fe3+-hydroxamate transport system substrate-binding protein
MARTVFSKLTSSVRGAVTVAILAVAVAACQGVESPRGTGTIISTAGETVPMGLEPAHVVVIDGRQVFPGQRGFALAPGVHEIRVAPHVAGPTHQVPTQYAMIRELTNDALELDVEAGWTYHIAMRVIEPPDYTNRVGHWQAVVARAIPPAD